MVNCVSEMQNQRLLKKFNSKNIIVGLMQYWLIILYALEEVVISTYIMLFASLCNLKICLIWVLGLKNFLCVLCEIYIEVSYDIYNPEIHCYTFRIMKLSNMWNAEIDIKHTRQRFLSIDNAVVHQDFVQWWSQNKARMEIKRTCNCFNFL